MSSAPSSERSSCDRCSNQRRGGSKETRDELLTRDRLETAPSPVSSSSAAVQTSMIRVVRVVSDGLGSDIVDAVEDGAGRLADEALREYEGW